MKKKIFIIASVSLLILIYIAMYNSANKWDSFRTVKTYFPQEVRTFVKKYFFFPKYQKSLEDKINKLLISEKETTAKEEYVAAIKEKKILDIVESYGHINFKKTKFEKKLTLNSGSINIQSFSNKVISVPKYVGKGTGYLGYNDNNIFVVSANGLISYFNIKDLDQASFDAKIIKSNIRDLIKYDRFFMTSQYGIKDVLISNNKIYISYLKQKDPSPNTGKWKNHCYSTSIISADLNYEFLKFDEFFSPQMCIKEEDERYIEYLAHQSGGRISKYKNDKLLFTIGDFRTYAVSQQEENVFGKIISMDLNGKNPKIISMGHRNPQGLFFDEENNIIFSTEHGPDGGDEVNYNYNLDDNKIENYGWAISSYGDHHYKFNDKQLDELFPLYKSHKDYGFEEPLTYFYPSIGISQIIKIPENNYHNLLVASMGSKIEEGDLSLHYLKVDKNFNILDQKILPLGQRIRDMIFIRKHKMVLMFFDTTSSIGYFKLN